MYEYHISTTDISLIIIPPCCSEMRRDFLFHSEEISIGFKESFLFQCPKCLNTYPSLKNVFKSWGILILTLANMNKRQHEYKKNSFTYHLSTNSFIYSFINDICEFKRLLHIEPLTEKSTTEEIFQYFSSVISIYGNGRTYKKYPTQPFLLSNLSTCCKKCNNYFSLTEGIKSSIKQIECPHCENKSMFPKKLMEEFLQNHRQFQNQIIDSYKRKILIIPFDVLGLYDALLNGDIEISNIL